MKKFLGMAIIVLALAITIIPQFTNCAGTGTLMTLANGTTAPMKCTWTARAEIATGVPILAIGAMMLFVAEKGEPQVSRGSGHDSGRIRDAFTDQPHWCM